MAVSVYTLSSGRLGSLLANLIGLTGVVVGGRALAGRRVGGNARRSVIVALMAGLFSTTVGGLIAATAPGGVGTGHGFAGAVIAVVVGTISMVLGGLGLARSRRTG